MRKVPPDAFPKTKGISLEESKLPPYNKLECYVQPKVQEEVRIEDVWFEEQSTSHEESTSQEEATRQQQHDNNNSKDWKNK